jgi:hypothetical protein
MKKRAYNLILLTVVLMLVASCTEKIDVKLDSTYTRLVVDGTIGSDTAVYSVNLSKTADYFYNGPTPRVVNATVTLSDGENNYTLHESEPGNSGIYLTDPGFHGNIKKDYTLHVRLTEAIAGTQDYTAECRMNTVTTLDSIQAIFQPDWGDKGFWEIRVFAQEPGDEKNFYLFQLYRNGTLLTDTISKYMITDDVYYNGNYINGATAMYLDNADSNQSIRPGDHIVVKMSGISEEYYNFIYQVQMSGFNIPFFSSPPANVVGNISGEGVGFFAAYSSTYAGTIVPQ